jgi:hypothetical protein
MGFKSMFKSTAGKALALLFVAIIGIIIISIITTTVCPKVLENLANNPDASEALSGICKSLSDAGTNAGI